MPSVVRCASATEPSRQVIQELALMRPRRTDDCRILAAGDLNRAQRSWARGGARTMRVDVGRYSIDPRDVAGVTRGAGARGLELTVHIFPPKKVRDQSSSIAKSALSASHQTTAGPPRRFARVLTDPSPRIRRVCSAAVNEAAISADPSRSPSTARRSSSPRGATSCAGACPTATSGAGERRAAATPSQGRSPPTPHPSRPRRAGSWCW